MKIEFAEDGLTGITIDRHSAEDFGRMDAIEDWLIEHTSYRKKCWRSLIIGLEGRHHTIVVGHLNKDQQLLLKLTWGGAV